MWKISSLVGILVGQKRKYTAIQPFLVPLELNFCWTKAKRHRYTALFLTENVKKRQSIQGNLKLTSSNQNYPTIQASFLQKKGNFFLKKSLIQQCDLKLTFFISKNTLLYSPLFDRKLCQKESIFYRLAPLLNRKISKIT